MNQTTPYQIRAIDEDYADQVLALVEKAPVEAGGFKLLPDRAPAPFFLPRLMSRRVTAVGVFLGEELVGFGLMLERNLYCQGKARDVLYFGSLVVDPSHRGRGFLFRLPAFFAPQMKGMQVPGYTLIMKGNEAAHGLLNRFHRRYPDIPFVKKAGTWKVKTILLVHAFRRRNRMTVRPATWKDLGPIAQLLEAAHRKRLFAPPVTPDSLREQLHSLPGHKISDYFLAEENGTLSAVCCAWDMGSLKRNRVLGFSTKLKRLRCLLNSTSAFTRFPKLPGEGEALREITVTDYAVKDERPELLHGLLRAVAASSRKGRYHTLLFGAAEGDPLEAAAARFMGPTFTSEVLLFARSKAETDGFQITTTPWIDMKLL